MSSSHAVYLKNADNPWSLDDLTDHRASDGPCRDPDLHG